jgi:hypothetical protein
MPRDEHIVADRAHLKEIFRDCSAAEIRAEIGDEGEALWLRRIFEQFPVFRSLEEVKRTDEALDLLLDVLEETRGGIGRTEGTDGR